MAGNNNNMNSTSLIRILEEGVNARSLVKSDLHRAYTGYAHFSALSVATFLPMNGNRALNRQVVASRVADNLRRLREHRPLAYFGQISLLVVADGPPDWLVMDGQHRLEVMRRLHTEHGVDVQFQLSVKVVPTEAEAHAELMLYQDQYPPDLRTFFPDRRQTRLAEGVVSELRRRFPSREMWPSATTDGAVSRPRPGLRVGDVSRPLLSENIVLGLLGRSRLLLDEDATIESIVKMLLAANAVLRVRAEQHNPEGWIGPNVTPNMKQRAASLRCHLGFLREDKLDYRDIRSSVDAHLVAQAVAEAGTTAAARTRIAKAAAAVESSEAEQETECLICESGPRSHAFVPCGHKIVCETCVNRVLQDARECPVCKQSIVQTLRIYG